MSRAGSGEESPALTRHIDEPLGAALRRARDMARRTRTDVAKYLRVSEATIQKYENGEVRIPATRLWQACRYLNADIGAIFADLPHHVGRAGQVDEDEAVYENEHERTAAMADLVRAAGKISTDRLILAVGIVKSLRNKITR